MDDLCNNGFWCHFNLGLFFSLIRLDDYNPENHPLNLNPRKTLIEIDLVLLLFALLLGLFLKFTKKSILFGVLSLVMLL